jgi:DNA-directed RNA polymerase subunit RPC12/RpoP
MAENRVVEGRMVTPERLAELVEGDPVMEVDSIKDADRECPDCGGDVLSVGYMPDVTSFVTGYKCQDCPWATTDRE